MSIKKKFLKYLEFKGVSQYEFYNQTGITNGLLRSKAGITEVNLQKILDYAPDISIKWLFLNKGAMLLTTNGMKVLKKMEVSEPISEYKTTKKGITPKNLGEYKLAYAAQKERIKILEKQLEQSTLLIDTLNRLANSTEDQSKTA